MNDCRLRFEFCLLLSIAGVVASVISMTHTPIAQFAYWSSGIAAMIFFVSSTVSLLSTYGVGKGLKSVPILLLAGGTSLFSPYFLSFVLVCIQIG